MKIKKILENFLSLASINVLNLLVPLLTLPIFGRYLTQDQLGKYFLFSFIFQFSVTVIEFGFISVGSKKLHIAIKDHGTKGMNEFISKVNGFKIVILLICVAVTFGYLYFSPVSVNIPVLLSLMIIGWIGSIFTSQWYFIAISTVKKLTLVICISRIVSVAVVLLLLNHHKSEYLAFISVVLPSAITAAVVVTGNLKLGGVSFKGCLMNYKDSADVFWGDFANNFYNMLPAIFIGGYYHGAQFLVYSIPSRISSATINLMYSLARAILPFLIKENTLPTESKVNKKVIFGFFFISLPSALIAFFCSDQLVEFFLGVRNEDVSNATKLISLGIFSSAFVFAFGHMHFLARSEYKIYRKVNLYVSIVSTMLAILFIYKYGALGGVITVVFARTLLAITFAYFYAIFWKKSKSFS
ncbi:lipopolysaccharide biosynthesis protein [Serratia fonticola]